MLFRRFHTIKLLQSLSKLYVINIYARFSSLSKLEYFEHLSYKIINIVKRTFRNNLINSIEIFLCDYVLNIMCVFIFWIFTKSRLRINSIYKNIHNLGSGCQRLFKLEEQNISSKFFLFHTNPHYFKNNFGIMLLYVGFI